ncbi:longevity assurance proteins LAG1/LAC1 [Calocera viscosa TUFC12733]|uniref:Longevity assurance proteins LAG1/LAC1 n=1 Tax=Calocera viscosa (strain TUFC12733) TaxID=1330018 RepID=A0A167JN89_CALVF|nr:longevity assurance proteins LAG1/LAC1 [Calocera viscosa TUFC12733]
MSAAAPNKPNGRRRASSMAERLDRIEHDPNHHLTGPFVSDTPTVPAFPPQDPTGKNKHAKPKQKVAFAVDENSRSAGLWEDLRTMRWMRVPASSAKILGVPILLWLNWHFLSSHEPNPFSRVLFISGRIAGTPDDDPRYRKSYWDLLFVAYYVVVFAFVRQSITLYILRPFARWWGIRKEAKLDRFAEQGYAIIYFGFFASLGIYVMSGLPTWWFRTEYFWLDYPHWDIKGGLKSYYLLQSSYWLQQLLVMVLGIEKPRKDFWELVAHHIVTLWLIGWSYLVNLTFIGNAVFITMDFSDIWLSFSKCLNYMQLDRTSTVSFIWLICIWTYMRHWLNWKILWSVWNEFDLVVPENRHWDPPRGVWLAPWLRYQIFIPIAMLQVLMFFWSFLMWRILYRTIAGNALADDRSDDEDEPDSPIAEKLSKED